MIKNKNFFIGIDLGGKEKRSTGICIIEGKEIVLLKDVFGRDVFRTINHYLEKTKTIAIDAPLTLGKGKGKMRLYEKFLSTKIFRKERINPLPPALMPGFHNFAKGLVKKLEKRGFILDLNLIEVFPTFVKKIWRYSDILKTTILPPSSKTSLGPHVILGRTSFQTENQESAFICALMASLHSLFKTRYLGYKDGFLFLPEFSFWKKAWQKKFFKAWKEKPYLKYRHLITNLFD